MSLIILFILGMLLVILGSYISVKKIKIIWLKKLYPIFYVLGFICLTIAGFGLKKLAFENGWWWLI